MSEIEKLYKNAHIEKVINHECTYDYGITCPNDNDTCENCGYYKEKEPDYPPFTAKKQIEIIKVISTNHISDNYGYKYLGIDRDEIDKEFYLNLCLDGKKYHAHDKDFAVALAKLVNILWQDLTDTEKTEIAEILN